VPDRCEPVYCLNGRALSTFFFAKWRYFFFKMLLKGPIMLLAIDRLLRRKIIDTNYIVCIPTNCGYHLSGRLFALRLLRSWFTLWNLLFWLFLRLGCEVMDPCFVHSNELTQKFIWITMKHLQHCFEIVILSRLWSTVSKRGTHLAELFHSQLFV